MIDTDIILNQDATAQAQHIKARDINPVNLLEAAINRINDINPKINAVVTDSMMKLLIPSKILIILFHSQGCLSY